MPHISGPLSSSSTCFAFPLPLLGVYIGFLDKREKEDIPEKGDIVDISAASLSTITSPSEIGVAGDEEYLEVEGN